MVMMQFCVAGRGLRYATHCGGDGRERPGHIGGHDMRWIGQEPPLRTGNNYDKIDESYSLTYKETGKGYADIVEQQPDRATQTS